MTYQPITHGRTGDSLTSAPDAAGFDLYRLDVHADALRSGPPLSREEQHELRRVIENLQPLTETTNGHAH